MKRRELEKKLRARGWNLVCHGRNAEGTKTDYVPRHSEINEHLAKAILKNAGG